jgi:hypothetical protein
MDARYVPDQADTTFATGQHLLSWTVYRIQVVMAGSTRLSMVHLPPPLKCR